MVRAALVGMAVTLACILVPVVHFVTALPAAFIGGYVAGARTSCTPGRAAALALLITAFLAGPVLGAALAASLLLGRPAAGVLTVGAVIVGWFAVSGALGALLGGASSRSQAAKRS